MSKIVMKRRGQVTIFIILAIIVVAGIITFFIYVRPTMFSKTGARMGFDGCVQNALEDSISKLEKTGGFINPTFYYEHEGKKLQYLCYTDEYYKLCTVQVPFVYLTFKEHLELDVKEEIDNCYKNSINELKSKGHDVVAGLVNYEVFLESGIARMKIDAPTVVGTQKFARFDVKLETPIYDMLMIATSILQYEMAYGDSDIETLLRYYPDYKITKLKMGEGTTIYSIENKISKNKYEFASRSLAWPPGYDIE